MTGPRDAAGAGLMVVSSIVVCAAIGFGVGSLFGAEIPLAFAGGFIGLIVGFRLVYTRFKDL
jgi:presenilin-like A22 family membrane protease